MGARWSKQDIDKLITLVNEGMSNIEIARILNRTPQAIGLQRYKLNLKKSIHLFTENELSQIKSMTLQGYSDTQIAKILGLNVRQVKVQRKKLGLYRKEVTPYYYRWPEAKTQILIENYDKMKVKDIAKLLHVTEQNVYDKIRRLKEKGVLS